MMTGIAGIITKTDLMKVYTEKLKGKWKVSDLMTVMLSQSMRTTALPM